MCERDLPVSAFRAERLTCDWCFAGLARVGALARGGRPHLWQLRGDARDCLVAWETARLAFSRSLRPFGVHVKWRGFEPVVTHTLGG